jgi:hypothetical protein
LLIVVLENSSLSLQLQADFVCLLLSLEKTALLFSSLTLSETECFGCGWTQCVALSRVGCLTEYLRQLEKSLVI